MSVANNVLTMDGQQTARINKSKLNNKDKDCQTKPQRNLSSGPNLRPNRPKNRFAAKPDEKKQENRSELLPKLRPENELNVTMNDT